MAYSDGFRNALRDQLSEIRRRRAKQRLAAPGAVLHVQPDDGDPLATRDVLGQRLGCGHARQGEAERRRHHETAAELEEPPSVDPAPIEVLTDASVGSLHRRASQRALRGYARTKRVCKRIAITFSRPMHA